MSLATSPPARGLWFVPCGTTYPQPARWLESFLGERGGQLPPLQRRSCDVGLLDAATPDRDELGQDADGDFFRRHGPEIETDGRVDAGQTLERHPFVDERVVDLLDLRLAADQADVAQVARRERS